MKVKKIMPISLIVIFIASLTAGPALASRKYRPAIHGPNRWERVYDTQTETERYIITHEEEKTGLIAGVFSAADWAVKGTLDLAGATVDGTEKMTRDVMTGAGNTVNDTMQMADDTVKGTTGTITGTPK